MKQPLRVSSRRRSSNSCKLFGAAASIAILSGPIQAQVIPGPAIIRTFDNGSADFTWANATNWSADTLPGIDDIANFNLAQAADANIELGGQTWEIGGLIFSASGAENYLFQNGSLITNNISQNNADRNVIGQTVNITTKNTGADALNITVSSDTLDIFGKITSGGLNKFGTSVLRLGGDAASVANAITGNINLYGGTLFVSSISPANGNPLGGTGNIVARAFGTGTVQLTLDTIDAFQDFERNIVLESNFTIANNRTSGTVTNIEQRVGTITMGTNTLRVFHNGTAAGFFTGSDGLILNAGSTATVQVDTSGRLEADYLKGDADTKLIKTGNAELRLRGNGTDTFAGDIEIRDGILRFDNVIANPLGNSSTDITFAALGTLQLRSESSANFAANVILSPGIFSGTINVDRLVSAAGQTLSLGTATISNGTTLNVTGANTFSLGLAGIVLTGNTGTFNPTSANVTANQLTVGAGATFIKTGGSTLTLNSDNSATALGTMLLRQGTVTATATGALGSGPVTLGNDTLNAAGFVANSSQLNYNATGASANATGTDVTVSGASQVTLGVVPTANETFSIKSRGVILGSAAELGALTIGANLTLETDAVIAHETPSSTATSVAGLGTTPTYFFGIGGTANTVPAVGEGTPWKGFSNDRGARSIIGTATTPATVTLNGADDDPNTVEIAFQGLNGTSLTFGSNASTATYTFSSIGGVATPTATKSTIAIRGYGGTSIGLAPGGNVALEDSAAGTNLAGAVDKIYVQSGTLLLGADESLGGVPVEVQEGGAIDVRTTAAMDGPVTIKNGGILFLNDAFQLTGSGAITIETGGKLDITSTTPASILTSTQAINFTGTGHTVRFAASEITNLDSTVPDAGVTYVVAGGTALANLPNTNLNNVALNTQSAGISLQNGTLANDATSRIFTGPINLADSNLTVAATQNTTLAVTGDVITTGVVTIGTPLGAIDYRLKTDANATRADGLPDPYSLSPQVVFTGAFNASSVTVHESHLAFANANTQIIGDLNFQGNVLYLDGGGPLSGGSSTKGDLTARLTDTSGTPGARVADRIILGDRARIEMSVSGAAVTVTQPFVITGDVNPLDKRTFWIDRADAAGTPSVFLSDILLLDGAQYGIDENATAVRSNVRVEGNAEFTRIDDWDLRNVSKAAGAPANVTINVGQPTTVPGGSNGALVQTVDGTVDSGITMDLIRGQLFFENGSVLNGIVRTQTAPVGGDSFVISRSSGSLTDTTLTGTGEIQLGRSAAINGPEDMDVRATEVASGTAPLHTVAVPVRVVNDGINTNIDAILRAERHVDAAITGRTQVDNIIVENGATLQTVALSQTTLTLPSITLGADSGIDSTNTTSVFLGNINGSTNAIRFTGQAQARLTGNVTASQINVVGAGLDFDPGLGNTSTINAPVSLSGQLSVRSGTADFGTNIITGAATQTLPGLRENKTQGSFDEVSPNLSNEIKLGPVMAQTPTNTWGEVQTVTYTGQIRIPDNGTIGDNIGTVAFAKWFDDSAKIVIDGVTYMRHTTFNDGVSTGVIALTPGLHDIEIRMGQGTGGAGPVVQDGGVGLGLGIDLTDPVDASTNGGLGILTNGGGFVAPLDNGTGNLFQTTTLKGSLTVASDAALSVGGFTNIGTAGINGFGSTLIVTGAGASDADLLSINGAATLNVTQASATVTAATQKLEGQFTKVGAGTVVLNGNDPSFGTTVFLVEGTVVLNGSLTGDVLMSGGRFSGNATVSNALDASAGGVITPGNGRGTMTVGSLFADNSTTFNFEIGRLGATPPVAGIDYDQLKVNGNFYDLGGTNGNANGAILSLQIAGDVTIGDIFTLILNQSFDTDSGTFANLANNSTFTQSGYEFRISYFDDPLTATLETAGGNSISLLVLVPEPSSAMAIFSGLTTLAGMRRFRRRQC